MKSPCDFLLVVATPEASPIRPARFLPYPPGTPQEPEGLIEHRALHVRNDMRTCRFPSPERARA
jgi:hypothetical protein